MFVNGWSIFHLLSYSELPVLLLSVHSHPLSSLPLLFVYDFGLLEVPLVLASLGNHHIKESALFFYFISLLYFSTFPPPPLCPKHLLTYVDKGFRMKSTTFTYVLHNQFPLSSELWRQRSTWLFEMRGDLKNVKDNKQANMHLAAFRGWTLFSCQTFLFNVYTASRPF